MVEMKARLYEAAELGLVKVLRDYLDKKDDCWEQVSPGGDTALHIAAYHGHSDFVRCLLSPHSEATMEEKIRTFLIAKNNRGNTALHEAARGGDYYKVVEELMIAEIELSDDLNAETGIIGIRNKEDESALFTAARNGRLNTVHILLHMGSAAYVTSKGKTPLSKALYHQHYGVVKVLLEKKPEMATQADNNSGWTPLHVVASKRNCPQWVVRMILKINPSLCYSIDKDKQQTALHIAAKEGNSQIVRSILEFGKSSVDMVDCDGRTALHLAVENGKIFILTLLLKAMQRLVNVTDNKGITALDIALHKSAEGERTFLYELIIYLLASNNREESWKIKEKRRVESSPSQECSKSEAGQAINTISINVILICTVTFAAAFTPPGGVQPNGKNKHFAVLGDTAAFKAFIALDAVAFCTSIVAAILLVYANGVGRISAISFSARLLPVSLYAMMASFTLAIYMLVASQCLWLAVFVIAVVIITFFSTVTVTIAYLKPLALLLSAYNESAYNKKIEIAFGEANERLMALQQSKLRRRRFFDTLDSKREEKGELAKEETREEIISKIRAHAQVVRNAHRFKQVSHQV